MGDGDTGGNWPKITDIALAAGDVVTIAGLVLAKRGSCPRTRREYRSFGLSLTVEQTEGFQDNSGQLETVA